MDRYLSEWKQTKEKGTKWLGHPTGCKETMRSRRNITLCYEGNDWSGVSLNDFLDCTTNPASNRQTWMLANLQDYGCKRLAKLSYEKLKEKLLENAKQYLRRMVYFGLAEYRNETYSRLGKTLEFEFNSSRKDTHTGSEVTLPDISEAQRKRIIKVNEMDMELYTYAKRLYSERLVIDDDT